MLYFVEWEKSVIFVVLNGKSKILKYILRHDFTKTVNNC